MACPFVLLSTKLEPAWPFCISSVACASARSFTPIPTRITTKGVMTHSTVTCGHCGLFSRLLQVRLVIRDDHRDKIKHEPYAI